MFALSLDSAGLDALDDKPLQRQKQHENRNRRHGRPREHQIPLRRVRIHESGDPHLDEPHVVGRGRNERPDERIPVDHEKQHPERDQNSLRQGQDDREKDPDLRRPVHFGRFIEFLRDAVEKLPQGEDAEGVRNGGDDQPGVRIHPPEHFDDHVPGNQDGIDGNHQGADDEDENQVAAGKPQTGQRVCGHRVKEQRGKGHRRGHDGRVEHIARKIVLHKEFPDRVEHGLGGKNSRRIGEDVLVRLERGAEHPGERVQRPDGADREHGIDDPLLQSADFHVPTAYSSPLRRNSRNWNIVTIKMMMNRAVDIVDAYPKLEKTNAVS